jgi:hypothetical protein
LDAPGRHSLGGVPVIRSVNKQNAFQIAYCPWCGARKGKPCIGIKRGLGVHTKRLELAWKIADELGIPEIKTRKKHLQNQNVTRRGRDKFQRHTYVAPKFLFRLLSLFGRMAGARGKVGMEKYIGELLHCDVERLCDEHLHGMKPLTAATLLETKTFDEVAAQARAFVVSR